MGVIGSISNDENEVKESTPEPEEVTKEATPEVETNKEELSRLAEEIIADDKESVKEKSPSIEAISPEPTEIETDGTNGHTEEDQGAKGLKDFMEKTIPDTDKIENGFTHITEDDVEIIGAVENESKLE